MKQYEDLQATYLYCNNCGGSMPVREKLLLTRILRKVRMKMAKILEIEELQKAQAYLKSTKKHFCNFL